MTSGSSLKDFYINLKTRRGSGRSRIACIRKTSGIMRRMLVANKEYRYINKNISIANSEQIARMWKK